MGRAVAWADSTVSDYLDVLSYIADRNPDAAERVAARIEATTSRLGTAATGRRGRVTGTYEKVVPRLPYVLAHEILTAVGGVERVTILHGARRWPAGDWPAS